MESEVAAGGGDRLLRALGVVKLLGGTRVLRGVDASFGRGQIHLIEGANGSGKSTLLSILAGRSRPSAGRALLQEGAASLGEGPGLRKLTGWLGHELGLYADLDAFQNVALHARLRGLDDEAAWSSVGEAVGILALRTKRVREMSRGQRQRVALARTLLGAPPVVLLDEPSTGLDAAAVVRLAGVLVTVVASGAIVVAVTHDAAFAEAVGGRRWRMVEGRLSAVESSSRSGHEGGEAGGRFGG